jgi:hypothetical protein
MFSSAVSSDSRLGSWNTIPKLRRAWSGCARRRSKKRRQHLDGGRLAGTVRPEEREDLAALDFEGDVVDRREGAKRPDKVPYVNHRDRLPEKTERVVSVYQATGADFSRPHRTCAPPVVSARPAQVHWFGSRTP